MTFRPPFSYVERTAHEHGWVRRPDLSSPGMDVWEQPDGTLYAAPAGSMPKIVTCTNAAQTPFVKVSPP